MGQSLIRNKWFILAVAVAAFFGVTSVRAVAAGTDVQLSAILSAGTQGLVQALAAYFTFLLNVLNVIW